MPYIKPSAKLKGFSLIENLILMVIVLVAIGAIFSTVDWAQRTYAFSKQDRDSREVLFSWVETFEAMWPTANFMAGSSGSSAEVENCAEEAARLLGTWNAGTKTAQIGAFSVKVTPVKAIVASSDGKIDLKIVIRGGLGLNNTFVDVTRSFNTYTGSTVSDDFLQQGA